MKSNYNDQGRLQSPVMTPVIKQAQIKNLEVYSLKEDNPFLF